MDLPENLWSCAIAVQKKFEKKTLKSNSTCCVILRHEICGTNADVTSWVELVTWEEKVWIHLLSCRMSWGHYSTQEWQNICIWVIRSPSCHWPDPILLRIPAVLHHLHPVHAGHRVLQRKHVKDLCFFNSTQDHLLGVFKAEGQYWGGKRETAH